ncbi:hypothetical protein PR202_gb25722 [Eleusine coracana subsp. coracana]|uniref:Uncharacterized protein n=1 Tax=Eleusine coracana subsp. coracana TaxID=191504 RepID=A0AAV5FQV4_ELECO|nr:hypothetical protein PR202_gb25722 [Eleusine coracana subsp. coracana]
MKILESLDLSWNELSSSIPSSITHLMFLASLNLSSNHLFGVIPTGSQLQTLADPSIYSNNSGLCGFPLDVPCSNGPINMPALSRRGQDIESLSWYYSIMAGLIFGFWGWWGSVLLLPCWRVAIFGLIDHLLQKIAKRFSVSPS